MIYELGSSVGIQPWNNLVLVDKAIHRFMQLFLAIFPVVCLICCTGQCFAYLIVLDFESTCWKDKKLNYGPEISK